MIPLFLGLVVVLRLAPLRAQDTESSLHDRVAAEVQQGKLDEALADAQLAVGQYPNSSELYQLLGIILFKKGLDADARTAFRRAIELDPSIPQNYYDVALVDLSEHRYDVAASRLEAYLRLDPMNAQAHLLLGRAYHNLNRTMPAIEQFKKALALNPQLSLAHYHLGYAYQSLGKLQDALEEFRAEIALHPEFYDAYWLAGNIELGNNQLDSAEKLFRKGIAVNPKAYAAHYGLAQVLMARKRFPEAEAELKTALAASPDHVKIHYALARTYQQMGKAAEAQHEFQICATLNARQQKERSGIAGAPAQP